METLCLIRDIYRSIREFEICFQQEYDLCLNEGMLLCSLKKGNYSSSEIAELLSLTNSNTSKVIKSVEDKGFVKRILGKEDKRQMYFSLTENGIQKLEEIRLKEKDMNSVLHEIRKAFSVV